jgi:hypothetical protein
VRKRVVESVVESVESSANEIRSSLLIRWGVLPKVQSLPEKAGSQPNHFERGGNSMKRYALLFLAVTLVGLVGCGEKADSATKHP